MNTTVTDYLVEYLSSYSTPVWATLVAGTLVVITLTLSLYLLFDHLSAYKNPEEQKFLIGVILMVPCYSVESFASLMKPSISVEIEILRDCYEAFAMYCFGRYLVACLGGEERTMEFMERQGRSKSPLLDHGIKKGIIHHPFPFNVFLKPWKLGQWVYHIIKFGIVQYVIIKALTAILAVVLEPFNVYCEGEFKWGCGVFYMVGYNMPSTLLVGIHRLCSFILLRYPYMAVVLNFSQSWALYCLVQFYTITKDELAYINPLAKFLTFKSIVFLTWWQGLAIALLYDLGLVRSSIAQALQFQASVQDFIICIEMGIASVAHLYVYPAKPYELMPDRFPGNVAVLGDYASVDCPIDPDEVWDSERPTKLRLPQLDADDRGPRMTIRESARDVFIGGGEYIVNDLRSTVTQAVVPVEKGITKFNQKLHKISQNIKRHDKGRRIKDDSFIAAPPTRRVIRGIDDPLLNGSFSDSSVMSKGKKHPKKSGYTSAESGGESGSDQSYGGYQIRGRRWVTKD